MRIFIIFIWLFSACVLSDESNYLKIGILDGGWPPYQQVTMEIPSGFSVDLINQLIEGVGFQPKWKIYHSWNAVKDALCRGDIDIIIDAFGNSNKGCVALTRSYHRSPYVLVVNPNSVFFENVDQVNEARIAVEEGFLLDEAFSSYYPGAKKIRVSDTFSALQAVKNDRADVYVGNKDVSYFLTQRHDDLIVAAQASVFIDSLRFGVSRDNSRLLEMINDAIDAFPRRKMAELEKKWFSFQHEFIGHSAVLLRPNERKLLKSFPPIKLVWDEKNSPLSFLNFKGKPEGVGKDYIDVLTRDLGIHFSYYSYNEIEVAHVFEASSFDAMIIPKRRVPALSQWVVSDKLFSVPVVIASKESDDFIVDDKLDNKRIIFSDYQLLNELDLPCEKLNYEVSNDVYTSLKKISQGDFDVYIGDLAAINRVLKNNTQLDIEVTKKTEVVNDYVLAVHDRYANLVPLVNRSVRAMKEWERENILNKWVSVRTFQDINWLEAVKKLLPFLIVALSGMVIASVGYWRLKKLLTYKNKIEADLKLAREKAEKYAQVKEDFLAKMSHEIRTPIHGIIGMLEQISMTKLNFEQTQMVGVASSSASSLYNIVSEVLDYSKLEAGKVEVELRPFLLCNLLDNILDIGSYEAKNKKLILKVHLDSKLKPMYEGDQYLLQQVMTNILNNALKFTSEGSVIITLEVVSIDDDRHTLRIGVRDSGLGMSEEEITRIFDPFEQAERSTTRRFGGTGLGLTICQQLVELMSGEIIIESEKGKGSWVGFTLPLKVIEKTHTEEKLEGCCVNVDIKDPILRTSLITNLISLGIKVANDDSLKTFSDHNDDAEVKLV
ncbi:ATP-binding protein [Salinivibrio sp. IB872]|uniref:ATP-binding protein n=1 Tax=Salinivibrio sp. IB872 TaxID=1766123 RepID=UPI0009848D2C|nr:transporter substrate-binding domain-containing protein [Salinivibrio sp. IB872]OOF24158.1 hypothetical protein BZJ18_13560 [Salinivibrio sp. IB872]